MNTKEEIMQAFQDYQEGKLASVKAEFKIATEHGNDWTPDS
jgi:hypothetical protein